MPNAESLADEGFERIQEGEFEAALAIAQELEELQYTAAFEIAALAYAGLDDYEKAVETLERGVHKAPDCWVNWQLLGNYRSDLGRHDSAAEAYERALHCPNVWEDSVRLNQAILACRLGDHDTALRCLDAVADSALTLRAASVRIDVLRGSGRVDDALSLADECLNGTWEGEDAGATLAQITAAQGRIRLENRGRPEDVRRSTMEAIRTLGTAPPLLALLRDIDDCYSQTSHYFRLLVHAVLPQDHPLRPEAAGYFITYDVVAENPEQGLEAIREFECDASAPLVLTLEEAEQIEDRPHDPQGVYWQGVRCYYGDEVEG